LNKEFSLETIIIDGNTLTIEEIIAVARRGAKVEIAVNAIEAINKSRERVDLIMAQQTPVYGINTGFGIFSEQKIPCKDAVQLSRNLILSHAVGTGRPLDKEVVRAAILVRANTLAKGFSGVRLIVVETLLALLNKNVTPVVPSQGSLGSSGDLAPLSHMALVFTTDANDLDEESSQAYFEDEILSGKAAMARAKIRPIILEAKEGLALNNGATFSAAIAALAIYDAETLLNTANVSLAMTLEAVMGCSAAFDERLHLARGHKGQIKVAEAVRELTK
jgi:histidine ammonia-lyase